MKQYRPWLLAGVLLQAIPALATEDPARAATHEPRAVPPGKTRQILPDTGADITRPRVRLPAPDFRLRDLAGNPVSLADFAGRPVLLNFWATFCAPCREEMPALQALWRDYRGRGLIILAIVTDRGNMDTVRHYIHQGGFDFPVLPDPAGNVRRRYEVRALPTSYLIGTDGRFLGRVIGARQWNNPAWRALIEAMLP